MTEPFPLIDLEGDAAARGRAYGRAAGERIEKGLAVYREDFARRGLEWDRALATADAYRPTLEAFDAELTREIAAIAEGADQPVAAIVLLNARTELGQGASRDELPEECTAALALPEATADGHLLHGQNWDWRPGCAETAVVLRIAGPVEHRMLIFCEAGQLARHGMNSAGIGLTANGLQVPDDQVPGGVPTPLMRRRMLMETNLAGAAGVLTNSPRSCSHALTISHAGGEAYCFETTPEHAFWLLPEDGILSHANHFKEASARTLVTDLSLLRHPESLYRDRRTFAALAAAHGKITRATFEEIFADTYGAPNSICRPPTERRDGARSATVATLIMDTSAGKMWLAPNPWDGAHFTEYGFA